MPDIKNSPEKARKKPRTPRETALIVGGRLRNRLLAHVMADPNAEPPVAEEGKKAKKSPLMTDSQVHAALGLLKKYMPDLKSVELSVDPDRPLVTRIVRTIIDPVKSPNAPDIRTPDSPQ